MKTSEVLPQHLTWSYASTDQGHMLTSHAGEDLWSVSWHRTHLGMAAYRAYRNLVWVLKHRREYHQIKRKALAWRQISEQGRREYWAKVMPGAVPPPLVWNEAR